MSARVVVITGASRGLGAGMAQALSERARLGLCARNAPILGAAPGRVVSRRLDVADASAVEAFAEEVASALGPIDLWINNAGVLAPVAYVRELDPAAFCDHLTINVAGVFHGSRAFIHQARARAHRGVLVNISSGAAQKPYQAWGAYCAAKAAVDRFTEVVALEEREHLRAHAVAPGVIDTQMQATIRSLSEREFPDVDKFLERKAEERFNSPAFVADYLWRLAFAPEGEPEVVLRIPEEQR